MAPFDTIMFDGKRRLIRINFSNGETKFKWVWW